MEGLAFSHIDTPVLRGVTDEALENSCVFVSAIISALIGELTPFWLIQPANHLVFPMLDGPISFGRLLFVGNEITDGFK